jgi:putative methionine-R-sulfoxide reductase with GAF domain
MSDQKNLNQPQRTRRAAWSQFIGQSIQRKIAVWTGLCLLVTVVIMIGVAAFSLIYTAINDAQQRMLAVAESEAVRVEAGLNAALNAARTLAQTLALTKRAQNPVQLDRDEANAILRQALEDNPQFLGVFTLWEPNAFDGLDAQYVNAPAHDRTGRFIPYWVRDLEGQIHVEALTGYTSPQTGDWYFRPRETKQEQVNPPSYYKVEGTPVLLTAFIVPIVVDGNFYGIVGVDLRIDFLQQLTDEVNLYDGAGQMVLISNVGTIAGMTGRADLIGQSAVAADKVYESEHRPYVQAGEPFSHIHWDEGLLKAFVPIRFGATDVVWAAGLLVPITKAIAEAVTALGWLMGAGVLLTGLALTLLWIAARQIAQPIREITAVAAQVSAGNLGAQAQVTSTDELGALAAAFNQMTAQLQQTLTGLQNRTRALAASAQVSRRLSTLLDQKQLTLAVAEEVQHAFGYYHAQIYLWDEAREKLALAGGTGEAGRVMLEQGHFISAAKGLVGWCAQINEPVLVPDVSRAEEWLPNPLLPDTKSEAAVPIALSGQVVGVLDVQHHVVNGLTQDDLDLLQAIANQIAVALRNSRSYEEARLRAETEARVNVVSQKIQAATSVEKVLETAAQELGRVLGARRASVQLTSPAKSGQPRQN